MENCTSHCTHTHRRDFLKTCFNSCCGLSATLLLAPVAARRAYGQVPFGEVIGQRSFARIEKVGDGNWALISTPFDAKGGVGDRTTLCNGGLIVGKDRILAIDSYRMPAGGQYISEVCKFLTGRLPTHIVHTHFHFDHLGGTQGFFHAGAKPEVIMTQETRKLAFNTYIKTQSDPKDPNFSISSIGKWGGNLMDASKIIVDETKDITFDLGGRTVTIMPMSGHTNSDLVIRDDETRVVFGGDLMWDGIFPNFMSSSPSQWRTSVRKIMENEKSIIVPGHGGVVKANSLQTKTYEQLLAEIEQHALVSHKKGLGFKEAANRLTLSDTFGDLRYMRNGFHEIAMEAWYKELK